MKRIERPSFRNHTVSRDVRNDRCQSLRDLFVMQSYIAQRLEYVITPYANAMHDVICRVCGHSRNVAPIELHVLLPYDHQFVYIGEISCYQLDVMKLIKHTTVKKSYDGRMQRRIISVNL